MLAGAVRRAVSEVHKYETLTRDKFDDTITKIVFIYIFILKKII